MWIKRIRVLNKEDIFQKIKMFEAKYGMPLERFEKEVVKGHEEELDERGIYPEYEEWTYYSDSLKSKKLPYMEESYIKPLMPSKPTLEIFTRQRLRILDVLNERQIGSVAELSKIIERDRSSVSHDLKILQTAEFVQLIRMGKKVVPTPTASKLMIEF